MHVGRMLLPVRRGAFGTVCRVFKTRFQLRLRCRWGLHRAAARGPVRVAAVKPVRL